MRVKYDYEYRILGKRGCECFRSKQFKVANDKMHGLKRQYPAVYFHVQRRSKRLDVDNADWGPWLDC